MSTPTPTIPSTRWSRLSPLASLLSLDIVVLDFCLSFDTVFYWSEPKLSTHNREHLPKFRGDHLCVSPTTLAR